MTPAAALPAEGLRFRGLWLISPRADLAIVALPLGLMLVGLVTATLMGQSADGPVNRLAIWTTQNILGNATHVALTWLFLGVRPEVLKAIPEQPRQVATGIPLMALVALGMFALYRYDKTAQLYVAATIFNVFGIHHFLSQSKGWWALHHLRGRIAGLPAPPAAEHRLLKAMVPLNLVLILTRIFLVPESRVAGDTPYIDIGQGPQLPYSTLALLLVVWLCYWVAVFRTLLRSEGRSGPKVLYLLAVSFGVGLLLVTPPWGNIVLPGMHGVEYYLLTAKLLEQRPGDAHRLPHRAIWPTMVGVMVPLCALGAVSALAGGVANGAVGSLVISRLTESVWWRLAVTTAFTVVLSHYWADALIFRFRIPQIRSVMLGRLGLDPGK